jgi:catechol 2,3-dioxygenase-like lactoylglutathione lyase family enzyme
MQRMTTQKLGYLALLVRDYDEAIDFYTQSLGFQLVKDTSLRSFTPLPS